MVKNLLKAIAAAEQIRAREDRKTRDKEQDSIKSTHHAIEVNGKKLKFEATTGHMNMKDREGKIKSKIFFTAYVKDGVKDKSKRPVTFSFNGGPGASSIWVQFGAMGPKRVLLSKEGEALPPPYKLVDNDYTWLQFTDLIFIDPVGTGFSRAAKGEDPKQFYGVKEDIESVGDFIQQYVSQNQRWLSPKYIAGESYGTTRAAGLSEYLQQTHCMDLNGLILISSVLNLLTIACTPGNDLPYALILPSYTAGAWYHGKLQGNNSGNLEKILEKVEEWAISEYLEALARGDSLELSRKKAVVEKLSQYTGLDTKFIENSNLRIPEKRFVKELLRDEGRTVGRLDCRYKGIDADSAGEAAEYDASFLIGPYSAAVNDYVRTKLEYESDIPYTPMAMEVNKSWKWTEKEGSEMSILNMLDTLRKQMSMNRYLRVLFACGYYDLATPYFAVHYQVNHLGLDPSLRKNIKITHYPAGHMIYFHLPSLKQMFKDVESFFAETANHNGYKK